MDNGWWMAGGTGKVKWQGQGCWVFVTNKERTEARQEQRHGKKRKEGRIMDVLCCPFVVYKKICWEVWCGIVEGVARRSRGCLCLRQPKKGQVQRKEHGTMNSRI